MNHIDLQHHFAAAAAVVIVCGTLDQGMAEQPPVAPVKTVIENYHGTNVADPYRYMEEFNHPSVQAWVKDQATYAEQQLASLPGRAELLARIVELDAGTPYTLSGITRIPNGDLFYFKQAARENVAKVYFRDGRTGAERLLIDPETFPKTDDHGHFTVDFFRVSPDASRLLYGFAASGSEQTTLKVFDLASGRDLPDAIDRLESEYAKPYWLPDGKSFVFSRRRQVAADAPPTDGYKFTQAFRHTIGHDPERAELVFAHGAAGSPAMAEMDFPAVIVPHDSRWAIGQVKHGDETDISLFAAELQLLGTSAVRWTKVSDRADQVTSFAVRGDDIYLLTARDAPRFQIVRTSLARPDLAAATVVVPPGEYVVNSLAVAQDALYVGVLAGVPNRILRVPYDDGASPEPLDLPADEPSGSIVAVRSDMPGAFICHWAR